MMKMRLKTHQLVLLSILIALVLACGAAYAYMFMRTGAQSTEFAPAAVSCEVTDATNIAVKNTGNIDAYIRVRLVTYWVDDSENVAAIDSPDLVFSPANGWIAGEDNTYYYPSPVAPADPLNPEVGMTLNLLSSPLSLSTENGCQQVVDVFAEAIQANPEKAAKDSWNVIISNSKITGVSAGTP